MIKQNREGIMKAITGPNVKLVTRTAVDWANLTEFLEAEGLPGPEHVIRGHEAEGASVVEIAARLCYMSFGKGRRDIADFITNLLASKDGSVLEHVNYGFVITGISRSLSHEFVRHRAGFAYSQRSQRYVDEADAAWVIPPTLLAETGEGMHAVEAAVTAAQDAYADLVSILERHSPVHADGQPAEAPTDRRKRIRQAARSVLPNATETKLFVTGNVRAWRHFIEMRATPYADLEIRRLAIIILCHLQVEEPLLFGDYETEHLADGTEVAATSYGKV